MSQREYEVDLGPNDRLRIRIVTERGRVIDFLVQQETRLGESYQAVVRYDCSHGFAHRDTLNQRGDVIDKQPFPVDMDLKQCLAEANRD
jgi:hypothetical protein